MTRDGGRPTRRELLECLGFAAAAGLTGCTRFDSASWFTNGRYDVDRRFRESREELIPPRPPTLRDEEHWSALIVSDAHIWEGEYNTTFVEIGDYLRDNPVDLLFQLGDLADAGWAGDYEMGAAILDSLGVPYYSAIGNHDLFNEGWTRYRSHFGPSVYTLPIGEVLFIVLDEGSATLGDLQRAWLEEELEGASAAHIVLLGHYPLWCSTDRGFSQLGSEQEVYDILNLIRRYAIEAHISGHTHRWAYTEFEGAGLYTVASVKEANANQCALRLEVSDGNLEFTRIPLGEEDSEP